MNEQGLKWRKENRGRVIKKEKLGKIKGGK